MKKTTIGSPHIATPYVAWSVIFIVVPLLMVGYYSFTDEAGNFTLANISKIIEYIYPLRVDRNYNNFADFLPLGLLYDKNQNQYAGYFNATCYVADVDESSYKDLFPF